MNNELNNNKMKDLNNIIKQIEMLENLGDARTMDQDTIFDELVQKADELIYG